VQSEKLRLSDWQCDEYNSKTASATDEAPVTSALKSFSKQAAAAFIEEVAEKLATYDWRTSSTPGLPEQIRINQGVFRGSSGYKEMRRKLLSHLEAQGGQVGAAAKSVKALLGYK
jgi:hypothetical protein